MLDILQYLTEKNIEYKLQGNEALIVCPYCRKEKLSININSGVYQCWVCKSENQDSPFVKGHISQLQEYFGDIIPIKLISKIKNEGGKEPDFTDLADRFHVALPSNKGAMKYLFSRGFGEGDIKRFKFGYVEMKDDGWISIPIYENDVCKYLKYRKITDNNPKTGKYEREAGGKSLLFNHEALDKYDEVILLEGEFDCATALKYGYENVVGLTVGAGTLKEEWYEKLILKSKIFLCLDPDPAGQGAAKDVWSSRLGIYRCWNILLPEGEDVNSFFMKYTKESFDELIKGAKQFKVDGVISIQDALSEMYRISKDPTRLIKYELPWDNVNRLLGGGLERGRLTVLSAAPGTGKTSFALQILYHLAIKYKMPSFFFCLEMPEVALATKIVQLHLDLTDVEVNYSEALIYSQELEGIPIYFGYAPKITPEIFYRTMVEVRNRYGVEIGVFDNLHRMIRSGDESEMGRASGMFKDLTLDLKIPFILIGQPRKKSTEMSLNQRPTFDMIKSSSAIPADADEVILLHRNRLKGESATTVLEPQTLVIIDKSRFSSGGIAKLKMIGEKSKFVEYERE
uniref:Putative helicase n=3 Tax=viral metagenome TaxID=1070528 RepID=A0A6H1ZSQ6_9ZZZZ